MTPFFLMISLAERSQSTADAGTVPPLPASEPSRKEAERLHQLISHAGEPSASPTGENFVGLCAPVHVAATTTGTGTRSTSTALLTIHSTIIVWQLAVTPGLLPGKCLPVTQIQQYYY